MTALSLRELRREVGREIGREAGGDNGPALLGLHRACPIEADFTLLFERDPDFFAWPEAVFDEFHYVGGFDGDTLVAAAGLGIWNAFTGTDYGPVSYVGDARVLREHRGGHFTREAAVRMLEWTSDIGFCLVKRGNTAAGSTVLSGVPAGFTGQRLCALTTANVLLMRPVPLPKGALKVRRAAPTDLHALADFYLRTLEGRLFAPHLSPPLLTRDLARLPGFGIDRIYVALAGSEIVGALGAWDTSQLKRTVVLRYSRRAGITRAFYAAARLLFRGMAPLPEAGQAFRALTATSVAVRDDDAEILRALLTAVHNDHLGAGYHMVNIGFTDERALAVATQPFFVQKFEADVTLLVRETHRPPTLEKAPYLDLRFL